MGESSRDGVDTLRDSIDNLSENQMMIGFNRESRIKIIDKGSKAPLDFGFGDDLWQR